MLRTTARLGRRARPSCPRRRAPLGAALGASLDGCIGARTLREVNERAHRHRTVIFSIDELRHRYGGKAHPIEIARRMRCTDCLRKSLTPTMRVR